MGLSIEHAEADRLAHELAEATGQSVTDAVLQALRERLSREREKGPTSHLRDKLRAIRKRCSTLPVLDHRSPEEIIGYDDHGLPH
jgi:antitoxin VapB